MREFLARRKRISWPGQSRTSREAMSLKSICRGTRTHLFLRAHESQRLRSIRLVVDVHCRTRYLDAIRSFVLPESSPSSLSLHLDLDSLFSFTSNRASSPSHRVSSAILSGCITYRAIEYPDHDLGTRAPIPSNHSIILSPCNAPWCTLARKPNWPAFKKGYEFPSASQPPPLPALSPLPSSARSALRRRISAGRASFYFILWHVYSDAGSRSNCRLVDGCSRVASPAPSLVYPVGATEIPINELSFTAKGVSYRALLPSLFRSLGSIARFFSRDRPRPFSPWFYEFLSAAIRRGAHARDRPAFLPRKTITSRA